MKTQINNLLEEIGQQMQQELTTKNFRNVANLAIFLKRAESLQSRTLALETEFEELQAELDASNATEKGDSISHPSNGYQSAPRKVQSRAENKTLRIEIDWSANGRPKDMEVIALPMAADGMATFLARMIEELGPDSIDKLAQVRINRGPLISNYPDKDFVNRKNGKKYGHKEIGKTGYYVLTNNQTSEKRDALKQVCGKLGLIPGSVKIRELPKNELYMERYLSIEI
ncbi:MAG: hypothetical protein Q8Q59_16185 [Luteolibacter sp.]|nr:hypothetical protein [Luteolibacter sp.]